MRSKFNQNHLHLTFNQGDGTSQILVSFFRYSSRRVSNTKRRKHKNIYMYKPIQSDASFSFMFEPERYLLSCQHFNVKCDQPQAKKLFARRWRRPVAFPICRQWYTTSYFPFRGVARNRWPLASHALCSLFRVWVWEKCRPGFYQLVFVLNSNLLRDLKWCVREKGAKSTHTQTHTKYSTLPQYTPM